MMTSLERPSEKSRKNIAKNVEKHIDPCYEKNTAQALSRAAIAEEHEIKSIIEVYQELGVSKDSVVRRLMEKKNLSWEVSLEKTALYWKA